MSATLAGVLFVAAALFGAGLLTAVWRRDVVSALAGLPAMGAGAAVAVAAASRFAPSRSEPAAGQELAVLVAVAVLALCVLGGALAAPIRERRPTEAAAPRRGRGQGRGARR